MITIIVPENVRTFKNSITHFFANRKRMNPISKKTVLQFFFLNPDPPKVHISRFAALVSSRSQTNALDEEILQDVGFNA